MAVAYSRLSVWLDEAEWTTCVDYRITCILYDTTHSTLWLTGSVTSTAGHGHWVRNPIRARRLRPSLIPAYQFQYLVISHLPAAMQRDIGHA